MANSTKGYFILYILSVGILLLYKIFFNRAKKEAKYILELILLSIFGLIIANVVITMPKKDYKFAILFLFLIAVFYTMLYYIISLIYYLAKSNTKSFLNVNIFYDLIALGVDFIIIFFFKIMTEPNKHTARIKKTGKQRSKLDTVPESHEESKYDERDFGSLF